MASLVPSHRRRALVTPEIPLDDAALWDPTTYDHINLGILNLCSGEHHLTAGWMAILRELFPSQNFYVGPWPYKEYTRAGADDEKTHSIIWRIVLVVELKVGAYLDDPRHRTHTAKQMRKRFGYISRNFDDPQDESEQASWLRQLPCIYGISAYGWRAAYFTYDPFNNSMFPSTRNEDVAKGHWKWDVLRSSGSSLLWALRNELVNNLHLLHLTPALHPNPLYLHVRLPNFSSDDGEEPSSPPAARPLRLRSPEHWHPQPTSHQTDFASADSDYRNSQASSSSYGQSPLGQASNPTSSHWSSRGSSHFSSTPGSVQNYAAPTPSEYLVVSTPERRNQPSFSTPDGRFRMSDLGLDPGNRFEGSPNFPGNQSFMTPSPHRTTSTNPPPRARAQRRATPLEDVEWNEYSYEEESGRNAFNQDLIQRTLGPRRNGSGGGA
ncbi:hypothetical protein DL93DRAFT_2156719 [Clavulina sp. PMI_390]|nr:hypothetical protein DL93DRAFT_2156719 [Clavulina sp. PMI_390]